MPEHKHHLLNEDDLATSSVLPRRQLRTPRFVATRLLSSVDRVFDMRGPFRIAGVGLVVALAAGGAFLLGRGTMTGRPAGTSPPMPSASPLSSPSPPPIVRCARTYLELRELADRWLHVWQNWARGTKNRDLGDEEVQRLSLRAGGRMAVLVADIQAVPNEESLNVSRNLLLRSSRRAQDAMQAAGEGISAGVLSDVEEARQLWIAADERLESLPC